MGEYLSRAVALNGCDFGPGNHWSMSGDILDCHLGEWGWGYWHLVDKAKEHTGKYPHNKEL